MDKLLILLAVVAFSTFLQPSTSKAVETSPFIFGGEPADIANFPYQLALLDMRIGGPGGYHCGASNIHRLWALTAAHCVNYGTPPELINLWGGSTSRVSGGHLFFITRYVMHPNYDSRDRDLDIAVIQVHVSQL